MMLLLSICLLFGPIGHVYGADPIVTLPRGNAVRGTKMTSTDGLEFFGFTGIPYAETPLADLRFKAPMPKRPWKGIYDATKVPRLCSQRTYRGDIVANEDCLFISVFTRQLTSKKLPVFVFIHEGGFNQGGINSTKDKAPERLMNKDLVVVLMSYRLGAFGFLSTGDSNFPGNYGLLDQNLALHWVQENIASFGGDPKAVTLAGQSAGGASVMLHMLSPLSEGLFQAAIAQSGFGLSAWAFQPDPKTEASELAMLLGCDIPGRDLSTLRACLMNRTTEEIINATLTRAKSEEGMLLYNFAPSLDNFTQNPFFPDTPEKLLRSGSFNKVPLMTGVTRDEYTFKFRTFYRNGYFRVNQSSKFDDIFDENVFKLFMTSTRGNVKDGITREAIREEYFDDIDFTDQGQINDTMIELMSDLFKDVAMTRSVRFMLRSKIPAVYLYYFDYAGDTVTPPDANGRRYINHETDLMYIFNRTILSHSELELSHTLIDWWSNFTTFGKPTSDRSQLKWNPVNGTSGKLQYLDINNKHIEMEEDFENERMNFWIISE